MPQANHRHRIGTIINSNNNNDVDDYDYVAGDVGWCDRID